jgi:hypothetical protein
MAYGETSTDNLIGVVYGYQRLSDEDGYCGTYCTIFSPILPQEVGVHDGYAKHGLLGYAHGEYPFRIFKREQLSRRPLDSRGIPEVGKPIQDQIKCHKDGRIDAASIAILPPMMYPMGRPPARWGAGARIPERRAGEFHFADRPMVDGLTEVSESQLRADFKEYLGFASKETDPIFANMKTQAETNKWLKQWGKVFRQIWSLTKQYGSETVYYRVVGLKQAEPVEFHRGEDNEEFDFILSFRTDSMDPEQQKEKLEGLARVVATFDKYGQVDYSEVLQIAVEIIDPAWAERIIMPKETGTQKIVEETYNMLAQIYAGVDRDIDLNAPPRIVLDTIQNYVQKAPDVQQKLQQDEMFRKRLEKIVKQSEFQIEQKETNSKIGRYGQ